MKDRQISLTTGAIHIVGVLNETSTADHIWESLPISGSVNIWGSEIYFRTKLVIDVEEGSSDIVASGDLAYWPPGQAVCVFYGPTPASLGDEIRAASPVNVFGTIVGDETLLTSVSDESTIVITKV